MSTGSAGSHRKFRKGRFTEINVTPLVDVMLVLLVIFMITAPMLTAGIQVDLPKSAAKPVSGQDEPIAISIRRDGKIFIQKTPVELDQLEKKLKAIGGEKEDTRIFVRGDKSLDYGKVMQVVGTINAAGYTKVALVTVEAPPQNR